MCLQRGEADSLDIPADAAFGKGKRHPRLEMRDDSGVNLRVPRKVKVCSVGPGIHEPLQPVRAAGVILSQLLRVKEQPLPQILPEPCLALGFGQASERYQVVGLHAVEVVLALGIDGAEDGVGVGLAVNVRDAPVVPRDRGGLGLGGPAGAFRALCRGSGERQQQKQGVNASPQSRWLLKRTCCPASERVYVTGTAGSPPRSSGSVADGCPLPRPPWSRAPVLPAGSRRAPCRPAPG